MNPGMILVQAGSVAFFLYLWVVMGWSDFNHQKIRNDYLRSAAWPVAACYFFLAAMTLLGVYHWIEVYPNRQFYQEALSSVFLCGAAAISLWWFGVWPAGDAKLFILLSALYPLTNFVAGSDYRRLFLAALINTFIPASIAVFLRSGRYVFSTRLVHRRRFLVQLGWKKELSFILHSVREAVGRLRPWGAEVRESVRSAAARPGPVLLRLGLWAVNMLVLSFFSFYLKAFSRSPILATLFWGGAFVLWSRLVGIVGENICRAGLGALAVGLLLFRPPEHMADLSRIFLNLTLFNLFFNMGINWTMTVLAGNTGAAYVLTLFGGCAGALIGAVAARIGGLAPAYAHTFFILSGMGLFFGLSLVLVRLWDKEVLPSAIGEVSSYVVLAPGFLERLRQDREFFDEHFARMYADGLTGAQAKAVQEWCAREGVEMIPLTPTISFAAWIFLGFFLARIMKGDHVMGLFFR